MSPPHGTSTFNFSSLDAHRIPYLFLPLGNFIRIHLSCLHFPWDVACPSMSRSDLFLFLFSPIVSSPLWFFLLYLFYCFSGTGGSRTLPLFVCRSNLLFSPSFKYFPVVFFLSYSQSSKQRLLPFFDRGYYFRVLSRALATPPDSSLEP